MELEMGEKTGADLEKLMQDYDRLSEEFRQAGGFTYEARYPHYSKWLQV